MGVVVGILVIIACSLTLGLLGLVAWNIMFYPFIKILEWVAPVGRAKTCPNCGVKIKGKGKIPPPEGLEQIPRSPEVHYPNFCPECGGGIQEVKEKRG